MQPGYQPLKSDQHTQIPAIATIPKAAGEMGSFDAWMWNYIHTSARQKQNIPPETSAAKSRMNGDEVEDSIELAWKFLEDRKYYRAQETCQAILTTIEHDLARDFGQLPKIDKPRHGLNGSATVELLKVLLRMVSEQHGVAAKVIATVEDLERIAGDDRADVPALHGWRRELFGEQAIALKRGRLALAMDKGKVVTVEQG